MTSAAMSAILLVAGAFPASAQTCPQIETGWGPGPYAAVAVSGDLAVVGAGLSLLVYNVADPAHPRLLAELRLTDYVRRIALTGAVAYAAVEEDGLHVIDVSEPAHPRVMAVVPVPGAANAVVLAGQMAVVADGAAGLVVVDISDPAQAAVVGVAETPGAGIDVAVDRGHAVLAEGHTGARIFDLTDPARPLEVASWGRDEPFHNDSLLRVAAADGVAFVAWNDPSPKLHGPPKTQLEVIDLSEPSHPSLLGSIPAAYSPTALTVSAGLVHLSTSRYYIIDVSDPTNPRPRSSTEAPALDLTVSGDMLWQAASGRGLVSIDVSFPEVPLVVGEHTVADTSNAVAASSDLGVLVTSTGLHVLDLRRPGAPVPIGRDPSVTFADAVVLTGRLAQSMRVRNSNPSSLSLIDLSDPARPRSVGLYRQEGHVAAFTAAATAAFIGLDDSLVTVDVSDPSAPVAAAVVPMTTWVQALAVDGSRLYVLTFTHLIVFDIADLVAPTELARLEMPGCSADLDVHHGLAVVGCNKAGYRLLDVSEPAAITEVGFVEQAGFAIMDVEIAGSQAILAELEADWTFREIVRVVDFADPSQPVEVGRRLVAGFGGWGLLPGALATDGAGVYLAGDGSGLEVFSTGSCGTAPPVAEFAWQPEDPVAGQPVALVNLAGGFPDSWWWEFGEGAKSLLSSPTHIFTTPGARTVTLTVANHLGSDTVSRDLVVQPAQEAPLLASAAGVISVIPAVAHTTGWHGTSWVTDVVLHNPGVGRTAASLYLLETGEDNSAATGYRVAVEAGHSLVLDDVVAQWFGETETSGAILIASQAPLLATSRTFTRSGHGTYGQLIPAFPTEDAARGTDPVQLIHLTEDSAFRTNLGLVNPGAEALDVSVDLHDPSGTLVGQRSYQVPARGHVHHSSFMAPITGAAYAVVSASAPEASYFAYASVVDNRSGDPTFLTPVEEVGESSYVPAAAHVDGLNGTRWRTDVELCATGFEAVSCTIELLPMDRDNSDAATAAVIVPAMGCVRYGDALGTLFGFSGTAALHLVPDRAGLVATSRTYNDAPSGTLGQAVPVASVEAAPPGGQAVRLSHLAHSPDPGAGFRTNVGVLNTGRETLEVLVDLYAGDGSFLGRRALRVPPHALHQDTDVFRYVVTTAVEGGSAIVGSSDPWPFIAYASVVDNVTGDPVYVRAQ